MTPQNAVLMRQLQRQSLRAAPRQVTGLPAALAWAIIAKQGLESTSLHGTWGGCTKTPARGCERSHGARVREHSADACRADNALSAPSARDACCTRMQVARRTRVRSSFANEPPLAVERRDAKLVLGRRRPTDRDAPRGGSTTLMCC